MTRSASSSAALVFAAVLLSRCSGCCPADEELCGGRCVAPSSYESDPAHCGGCETPCAAGASCRSGTCSCPAGQEPCNFVCVSVAAYATDPANCGGCGISCGPGTCADGACQCGAFDPCPSQIPRCVDGLTDPQNCGIGAAACGHACPLTNDVCAGGTCRCPDALPDVCGWSCVSLASPSNCGACGNACAAGATCVSGACECPADAPDVCAGACVNRQTDLQNCGTCGTACPIGASCATGQCSCPAEASLVCTGSDWARCCAGTGCCAADVCQTMHTNGYGVPGLGQTFYDCRPLGTYDATQAEAAARAWEANGTLVPGLSLGCATSACIGWQTATACGVWCYAAAGYPLRGRATLNAQSRTCFCPALGDPNWN